MPDALSHFQRLWLCEAVRQSEATNGSLEDAEANRRARLASADLAQQISFRALWLAQRDGLVLALQRWIRALNWSAVILALLAVLTGATLALGALGDGSRPVNVFWALGSLLGLHLLTLVGWLLLPLLPNQSAGLGRLWLWLSARLSRDARGLHLPAALNSLLQRRRLQPALFGILTHGLWSIALSAALVMLLLAFSARQYSFLWETTLLSPAAFISLTQTLGALPALLGFAIPDPAQIAASANQAANQAEVQRLWANWLLGVVLLYGLLPRLVLLALCSARWLHGKARLQLDLSAAGYAELRERLQPSSQELGIWEAAPAQLHHSESGKQHTGQGALLVAIELDGEHPWPPTLAQSVGDGGVLDSREQRNRLLEQLTRAPLQRLLIACDPRRSPDRGTLALIAQLSRCSAQTQICLLPAPAGQQLSPERLADWHEALDKMALPYSSTLAQNWLETGHD